MTGSPRVGVWIDKNDFLHQELTADGRYDETRCGRPHAYQGRCWIDGDRIDHLNDLGFWAFGEFRRSWASQACRWVSTKQPTMVRLDRDRLPTPQRSATASRPATWDFPAPSQK